MAKLIYEANDTECREASTIEMELPENVTISEYKLICKRMAAAMGYGPNSIKDTFGTDDECVSFSDETIVQIEKIFLIGKDYGRGIYEGR